MYKKKKKWLAMILAGGQGSRLKALTDNVAKPAVSFGGKYRIIDFTLSNCVNSDIDTVGVLTQYQPLELNDYVGNGQPWDLDRTYGGVRLLPPYQGGEGGDWYRGTANAIYQNKNYIDQYDPDYILVLSGDHIYKMNYKIMLDYHIEKNAAATIAVIDVPLSQASRVWFMNSDENGKIYEFEEKPQNPKSTQASMGVYIFNTDTLFRYLEMDEQDETSEKDFGKNIIPLMLSSNEALYCYQYGGYWKDVGTVDSLWEANMDLLGPRPKINLVDPNWRVYSRHVPSFPQIISEGARISNSFVTEGCEVAGEIYNSVLFGGVKVEKGAVIKDSVIMRNCVIKSGAVINYTIMDEMTVVGAGAKVGAPYGEGNEISLIPRAQIIEENAVINEQNQLQMQLRYE
jgi:glucose-1-phosphate adenylyltransferase